MRHHHAMTAAEPEQDGDNAPRARNCIVLGAGRSGTSMVGGLFRGSGYYMGENLLPGTASNPKGYFEDPEINAINEAILRSGIDQLPFVDEVKRWLPNGLVRNLPGYGRALGRNQWWLVSDVGPLGSVSRDIAARIEMQTARVPFCLKDPRFVHTLPAWGPWLPPDLVVICVFRHPSQTVRSMLKDVTTTPYLRSLRFDEHDAYRTWRSSYTAALEVAEAFPTVFVSYEALLSGIALTAIELEVGVGLDASFIDPSLHRAGPVTAAPDDCEVLFEELNRRAVA